MRPIYTAFVLLLTALPCHAQDKVVLIIHGGAGAIPRKQLTPELETQYRQALELALKTGHEALAKGNSLDGVEAAIKVMEDSPLFNAGKGAVFNRDGRNELNASIMDGKTKKAGAVAGISRIKNPISACRVIMEKSEHVFLIGAGAERYCRDQGVEMVSPLYFWTERAWKQLQEAEEVAKKKGIAAAPGDPSHFGTVGAAACDKEGNLAAGTSTGGITYVRAGRVGDSPIIGAGTYAENATCAVSCTGKGELFMRFTVASDIAARMKYRGDSLKKAADDVLAGLPKIPGGAGGIIALDRQGNVALPYSTNGMYRGTITQSGKVWVAIFEEPLGLIPGPSPKGRGANGLTPTKRAEAMGIKFEKLPSAYLNWCNRSGKTLYTCGFSSKTKGRVGKDLTTKQGYDAAKECAVDILRAVWDKHGTLDNLRVVKVLGCVHATPDFTEHPQVINGCSDMLHEIFGAKTDGHHARSALGFSSLPFGAAVEIEAIFEIKD